MRAYQQTSIPPKNPWKIWNNLSLRWQILWLWAIPLANRGWSRSAYILSAKICDVYRPFAARRVFHEKTHQGCKISYFVAFIMSTILDTYFHNGLSYNCSVRIRFKCRVGIIKSLICPYLIFMYNSVYLCFIRHFSQCITVFINV